MTGGELVVRGGEPSVRGALGRDSGVGPAARHRGEVRPQVLHTELCASVRLSRSRRSASC